MLLRVEHVLLHLSNVTNKDFDRFHLEPECGNWTGGDLEASQGLQDCQQATIRYWNSRGRENYQAV